MPVLTANVIKNISVTAECPLQGFTDSDLANAISECLDEFLNDEAFQKMVLLQMLKNKMAESGSNRIDVILSLIQTLQSYSPETSPVRPVKSGGNNDNTH